MPQTAKLFAERLNQCLDDTGAPISIRERSASLSKMLGISKHIAWSLVDGHQLPDAELLQKIAREFEVETEWLNGQK